MAKHLDKGKKGETDARFYLQKKGYQILECNWRSGRSEIDIIAMHKNTLVFIEVKMRNTNVFGYPEEFVKPEKQKQILKGSLAYTEAKNWSGDVRFDIVSVTDDGKTKSVLHIEDAFYPFNGSIED